MSYRDLRQEKRPAEKTGKILTSLTGVARVTGTQSDRRPPTENTLAFL